MRLKLTLLSTLLFTLVTALYFYHVVLLEGFSYQKSSLDLTEFKSLDHSLNEELFRARANLGSDKNNLNKTWTIFVTQKDIILDHLKSLNTKPSVITTFETYFQKKKNMKENIENSIEELHREIFELNPAVDKLATNKITFTLEKKDFYKELVVNSLLFTLTPEKEQLNRYLEDRKILQQILTFTNTPNELVINVKNIHDNIYEKTMNLENTFKQVRTENLENEINLLNNEILSNIESEKQLQQRFILVSVIAVALYIGFVFYFLRKFT